MPIVGRYFPSQRSQEKVFLLLRRHWFTYIPFLIITFIMAIPFFVLIFFLITSPASFTPVITNVLILASSAYILFIIGLLLFGFTDYYLDVYIVTNERIVDISQDGFFRRSISELYLREVQDVSASVKGFFATTLHYGDITIQTAGERPNFVFKSVPNPYKISKIIVDLHEAAIEGDASGEGSDVPTASAAKVMAEDEDDAGFRIDPKTASLARQRTKDYMKGEKLVETQLSQEVAENLEKEKSENLIKNIDNIPKKVPNETKSVKISNKAAAKKKVSDPKNDRSSSEGEMHENQEIDV